MEEILDSLINVIFSISLIALASVFVGHILVRKALVSKGVALSKSKLVGSAASVVLLLALSFFSIIVI